MGLIFSNRYKKGDTSAGILGGTVGILLGAAVGDGVAVEAAGLLGTEAGMEANRAAKSGSDSDSSNFIVYQDDDVFAVLDEENTLNLNNEKEIDDYLDFDDVKEHVEKAGADGNPVSLGDSNSMLYMGSEIGEIDESDYTEVEDEEAYRKAAEMLEPDQE